MHPAAVLALVAGAAPVCGFSAFRAISVWHPSVPVHVTARSFPLTDQLNDQVQRKVSKAMDRLGGDVISCHVTLEVERTKDLQHSMSTHHGGSLATVFMSMKGGAVIKATERADSVHSAIDMSVHSAKRSLARHVRRLSRDKHAGTLHWPVEETDVEETSKAATGPIDASAQTRIIQTQIFETQTEVQEPAPSAASNDAEISAAFDTRPATELALSKRSDRRGLLGRALKTIGKRLLIGAGVLSLAFFAVFLQSAGVQTFFID